MIENNTTTEQYNQEQAQLEWERQEEIKSENMMLGIYEEGVSVDQYYSYRQRW